MTSRSDSDLRINVKVRNGIAGLTARVEGWWTDGPFVDYKRSVDEPICFITKWLFGSLEERIEQAKQECERAYQLSELPEENNE